MVADAYRWAKESMSGRKNASNASTRASRAPSLTPPFEGAGVAALGTKQTENTNKNENADAYLDEDDHSDDTSIISSTHVRGPDDNWDE
ncbi:hypothetical protein ACHAPA_011341 [Fusarium lateritium]